MWCFIAWKGGLPRKFACCVLSYLISICFNFLCVWIFHELFFTLDLSWIVLHSGTTFAVDWPRQVSSNCNSFGDKINVPREIIIIMYIYHALINAPSAHTIHINLNMIRKDHALRQCSQVCIYIYIVAGELCKLARVTGPEFPHPFSPVGRCLPATGRCRAVRYKRQCLPGFCTMCWKVLVNPYPPPPPPPRVYMLKKCVALPLVIKRPVLQSAGMHV